MKPPSISFEEFTEKFNEEESKTDEQQALEDKQQAASSMLYGTVGKVLWDIYGTSRLKLGDTTGVTLEDLKNIHATDIAEKELLDKDTDTDSKD